MLGIGSIGSILDLSFAVTLDYCRIPGIGFLLAKEADYTGALQMSRQGKYGAVFGEGDHIVNAPASVAAVAQEVEFIHIDGSLDCISLAGEREGPGGSVEDDFI